LSSNFLSDIFDKNNVDAVVLKLDAIATISGSISADTGSSPSPVDSCTCFSCVRAPL